MNGKLAIKGRSLVPGRARGKSVVLHEPLSLWGGFGLEDGTIIDVNHPQAGTRIAGCILVMPGGRGSSSSSSILLESARLGIHPLAIVLSEPDPILVIGALLAADLYGVTIPVVQIRDAWPGSENSVSIDAGEKDALIAF